MKNIFIAIAVSTVLVNAADQTPSWAKAITQWTNDDATELLKDSPWAKTIKPVLLPGLSADARRQSGDLEAEGGGRSAGLGLSDLTGIGTKDREADKISLQANHIPLAILARWESAMPVRAAEIKMKDEDAPDVDGEDYAVAVYEVPLKGAIYHMDTKLLAITLKQNAYLKQTGKKDLRPSRVVVRQDGSSIATIVYFFPRASRYTTEDSELLFTALVGRLFLSQHFNPSEMLFQGKLEL